MKTTTNFSEPTACVNTPRPVCKNGMGFMQFFFVLAFFMMAMVHGAFAQNSCTIVGWAASAPYPEATIESCADGTNLQYISDPSIPSTYSWSFALNTSGASIVGSSTLREVTVNPGSNAGAFFLICTVTGTEDPTETNSCGVSVAVYKPSVIGTPDSRCGAGEVTLLASGLSPHSTANWYTAPTGGIPVVGTSFTTTVTATTSFWVSNIVTTPLLGLTCDGPRVEVVATVYPPATADADDDQTICAGETVTLNGAVGGGATSGTWTTSGTGLFAPNATTLNAVYTPSAEDIVAGTVTLTLTTDDPEGDCLEDTDTMVVTIDPPATADADDDQTICAGETVTLNGAVGGGATSGTWSGGTGLFTPNATTLNAVYTPSAEDIVAGTVTLTLTTDNPEGPCLEDTDTMVITINPPATADADDDQTICAGETVTLNGAVGGSATSGTWSGGTGSFNPNATTLNAIYTPSAEDIVAGTVTLTLTTDNPEGPCLEDTDTMVITINPPATADADDEQTVCAGATVTLDGSVGGGATSGTWTTSGSGSFTPNATTLNAVYTPSADDIAATTVTLTLTTNDPDGPCLEDSDTMVITINPCGGHLFPTQTTCCHYITGTATALQNVCTKVTGNVVNNAIPGVFFYYSSVVAPAESFTIEVRQTNDGDLNKLFNIQGYSFTRPNTQQIRLFTSNCGLVAYSSSFINSGKGARLLVTGATPGATYIVSIKYETKSIIGATYTGADQISTYSFGSYINNTLDEESVGHIDAVAGCSDNTPLPGDCTVPTTKISNINDVVNPANHEIFDAYPVPFKNQITIKYNFDYASTVRIDVYSMNGILIHSETDKDAYIGKEMTLNITNSKGIEELFVIKVTTNKESMTKKVISSK
jgi:Ig-like domain CHU_C associated